MIRVPGYVILLIIIIFGFLCGSTAYFYNKTRASTSVAGIKSTSFSGTVTSDKGSQPDPVDTLTKPGSSAGRLSYSANVYTVLPGESLFVIASKLKVSQDLIIQANNITDANSIQAGDLLAIPKLFDQTNYYRLNFIINDDVANSTLQSLRSQATSDQYDPVKVAKQAASSYFGIKTTDTFTLANQDLSKGTAVVTDKLTDYTAVIGLAQPKTTGDKGFWAMVYIEKQDN